MDLFKIDIGEIAELGSQVAIDGTARLLDSFGDQTFGYMVDVAVLVYEMYPGF